MPVDTSSVLVRESSRGDDVMSCGPFSPLKEDFGPDFSALEEEAAAAAAAAAVAGPVQPDASLSHVQGGCV